MERRSILVLAAITALACQPAERKAPPATDSDALLRSDGYQRQEYRGFNGDRRTPAAMPAVAHAEAGIITGDALPMPAATNMVIRTATASIKVDSLEPAVAAVRELAARVGGFVANTGIQSGEGQLRSATIEVKVAAARFDEALAGIKGIGELESANVEAEDIGEEYVDVTARMDNSRRLERRLIDLLATRTGKLKDVLDVEQSLARVREEIERYEGRLRYLRAHTAMSTLTVYVHEPVPVVGTAGTSVMGEAFRQAWRNFVTFLAVLVQALGVLVPLGVLAAAGWFGVQRWRRVTRTA